MLQQVIDVVKKVLGVDLGFVANESTETICATIFLGLSLYILAQLWMAHSNHKQDRRNYEYKRSQDVNFKRYESELEAVRHLSKLFMELRLEIYTLRHCELRDLSAAIAKWNETYEEAALTLGEAAPVLNLRKLKDGSPTCGVHIKKDSAGSFISWSAVLDRCASVGALIAGGRSVRKKAQSNSVTGCRPSLYLRGAKYLDACMVTRSAILADRFGKDMDHREAPLLFVDEDDRFIFEDADYWMGDGHVRVHGDAELGQLYKKFVNCAFCRLRNSDTGQKDARRINRRNAWRSGRAECFPWLDKYDRECPHTK